MVDPAEKERLKRLDARIAALKAETKPEPTIEDHHSQAQVAWRMVTELVAGLLLGFGIGYGLDVLFGTLPLFLVIFVLLGFIAGVRTMLRSAQELQKEAMGTSPGKDEE